MIKVSIIVPVYNKEKYIKRCIESILNQTLDEIEILIINDGSSDNSLNIINELIKKDKRVIVVDKNNEGLTKTRNLGLKLAKGKYILFVDADDYIEKSMLEDMYKKIEKDNLDLLTSDIKIERNSEIIKIENDLEINENDSLKGKEYLKLLLQELAFGAVWNKLIRREMCIDNKIFFNEKIFLGEDYNFLCRLSKYLNKVGKIENSYYHYIKESNESSVIKSKNIDDIIIGYRELENFYRAESKIYKLVLKKKVVMLSTIIFNKKYTKYKNYFLAEKELLKDIKKINLYNFSNTYRLSKKRIFFLNILISFPCNITIHLFKFILIIKGIIIKK